MAFAFPLNTQIPNQVAHASAPHRTIKNPAELTSYFLHNIPQSQLQMRAITTLQQHYQQQSQILQCQTSNTTRFVGAAPKLPKRGVNSFMAFRGKIHKSTVHSATDGEKLSIHEFLRLSSRRIPQLSSNFFGTKTPFVQNGPSWLGLTLASAIMLGRKRHP